MSKGRVLAFLMALAVAVNGLFFSLLNTDEIITAEAAEYGAEYLTGVNLDLYNALKPVIYDIAAGEVSSTVVTVSLDYTYSELGARTYRDARNTISRTIDKTIVVAYLVYDCPYELYWFDKTVEVSLDEDYSKSENGITANLTLSFYVATDYQGEDEYTVNEEKVALVNTAIENAQAIVDKYADMDDVDKLTAYKDEICELVSYEEDYADADYGDIWQIIWVFDGDDSTNVVCEGYAKAFQYLCDLSEFDSDIECYTVTGYTSIGMTIGAHMWNVIRIDGISYMVDVTNSDTDSLGETGELFMVSADDAIMSNANGYIVMASEYRLMYTYDTVALRLYSSSVLTLGSPDTEGTSDTEDTSDMEDTSTTEDSTDTEDTSDMENSYDTEGTSTTQDSSIVLGDVNGDGSIDYLDAMTVLRYDAELVTLTDGQLSAGDVNGDGSVDSLDAIMILRYDAGLIESFS